MVLLKDQLRKHNAIPWMKNGSQKNVNYNTHLAIQRILPVSPFLLLKAVVSCARVISSDLLDGAFARLRPGFVFSTQVFNPRSSWTHNVSLRESTCPSPW